MISLIQEKQIGPVSYMVDKSYVLRAILEDEKILRSRKQEYNPMTKRNDFYISFSRNMTAASTRNESRWKYGVIINGTKLSNKYSIEPVSYIGTTTVKSSVMLKTLTAYENDTYYATFVKFPSLKISRKTYDMLKTEIENMPEKLKDLKKFQHQVGGKRMVKGTKIKEKFNFNVPTGGLRITSKDYPNLVSLLQKDPGINEYEERIWLKNSDYFIDIRGCIDGIILPRQKEEDEDLDWCITYAKDNNLKILFY